MCNTLNLLLLAFVLHTQIQLCYSASSNNTALEGSLPVCKTGGTPHEIGNIKEEDINEPSGMAISNRNDNLLWIIEGSNNTNTVFGVRKEGDIVVKVTLEEAENIDWEAITTAPCEKCATCFRMCIFVADVGDNCRDREHITMYKFHEPDIIDRPGDDEVKEIKIKKDEIKKGGWTSFHLTYPDERHNCQSIVIDPITRSLILITTGDFIEPEGCTNAPTLDLKSKVFTANVDTDEGTTRELTDREIDFPFRRKDEFEVATDASVSRDGNTLIVRTLGSATIYKKNSQGSTVLDMMKLDRNPAPCVMELEAPLGGNGVSIHPDGKQFYITSEYNDDFGSPIFQYELQCEEHLC